MEMWYGGRKIVEIRCPFSASPCPHVVTYERVDKRHRPSDTFCVACRLNALLTKQ